MKLTERQRISQAIINLLRNDPFFASILLSHEIIENVECGTIAINGKTIKYNPEWTVTKSRDFLEMVLTHEALHIACGHHLRSEGMDAWEMLQNDPRSDWFGMWNEAGDVAINQMLMNHKGWDNKECLTPQKYGMPSGKSAEWYYSEIRKKGKKDDPESEDEEESEKGKEEQDGEEESSGADGSEEDGEKEEEQQDGSNGEGEGEGKGTGDGDGENEGAQGQADGTSGDAGGMGRVEPDPDVASGEQSKDAAVREWQQAVMSAAIQAKAQGKLPGWMQESIEAMMAPAELPWQVLLRQFCTKAIKSRLSFARPNRRTMWRSDIICPTRSGRTVDKILFVVDTSGSMNSESCNKALAELQNIVSAYPKCEVTLMQCDAMVADEVTYGVYQPFRVPENWTWKGRGGTDMRPAFERAKQIRPQAVICLTDGYMNWPENPSIPTMWLMVGDIKAPWGETIKMK